MSNSDSIPEITSEVVTLASSIHGYNTRFPSESNFFFTAVEHFLSPSNHAPNDMQVIAIKKSLSYRDPIRKAMESDN